MVVKSVRRNEAKERQYPSRSQRWERERVVREKTKNKKEDVG